MLTMMYELYIRICQFILSENKMCNQSFADKIFVGDYEPDFSKLKNTLPPDIYLITKVL